MKVCLRCKAVVFPDGPEHACDGPFLLSVDTHFKLMRLIAGEPLTISLVGPSGEPKQKRGRPGLPIDRKDSALDLFVQGASAREVAKELYGVEPTDRQIRNIYKILEQHEKTITGGKYPSELHLRRRNLRQPKHSKKGRQN